MQNRSGIIPSGGASTVQKPGHFEVRKSSSQVTRMHFFLKKVDDLFSVVALKTQAANAVSPFNEAVRYGNIFYFFIFCSHYYRSEAIRRVRQGGARA